MELLIVIYAAKFHLKHAGNFKVSLRDLKNFTEITYQHMKFILQVT